MTKTRRKERPGVMLYFDTINPALNRLSLEDRGRLFTDILNYAQTGEVPDYTGMLGMAFDMIRPAIDRDGDTYEYKRLHGMYMAYCKDIKAQGKTPISEESYIEQLSATDSNYQLPSTSHLITSSNPTAPSLSSPSPYTSAPSSPCGLTSIKSCIPDLDELNKKKRDERVFKGRELQVQRDKELYNG